MNFLSLEFELPLMSFIFILLLCTVYFLKKKISLFENKMYEVILICSAVVAWIDTIIHVISAQITLEALNTDYYIFIDWLNKIISSLFVTIFSCLFLYILIISYKKIKEKPKIPIILLIVFDILFFIVMCFTHITIFEINNVKNVSGATIILGYLVVAILLLFTIIFTLKNFKKDKRYYAIFCILMMLVFLYACSLLFKGLIIYDLILALLCYIMYFSIENPDVKMIEQLNLARDQAEKANRAKTDFLSSMSHEIRTPLNAIVGFSECINSAKTLEEAKEDAKDIVMASQNLLEIVNGILDISKIEADKMEIVNNEYNLKEILGNLSKLIIPRISEKPIELRCNFAPDIPDTLYGDSGKVKQIITNILTNAAKYTEKGYIDFNVNCVNNKNTCKLIISIKDTGRGIKKEQMSKLFTKFQRLDEDKNTTTEGTGLGLAITKRLVEMLGGKIVVQSAYQEGSVFTIYLTQEIRNTILKTEKEETTIDLNGQKILVVDDNKLNLKVITKILKNYNIDIDCVESGFACLEKIKNEEKYDIIFMDIMMPKMSGLETLKKLKEIENFNIPVIALTADALQGKEEKYKEVGFDGYLAKPIDQNELKKVLSKLNNEAKKIEEHAQKKEGKEQFLIKEGIDVETSLEFLGDIDMYNDTLREFLKESETRLPSMEKYKNEEDCNNYAILAHAMKSDSKYLGFKKLAELSYQHEIEGKNNNIKYIKENYDELMNEVDKIIKIIKEYLEEK